jgi:hypothetical protein
MGSGPPSRQDTYQSAPVSRSRAGGPASEGRGQCPDRRAPRERLGHSSLQIIHSGSAVKTPRWRSGRTDPSALRDGELADLADAAAEEVSAAGQVLHVPLVDLVGSDLDGLVLLGLEIGRPGVVPPRADWPCSVSGHNSYCAASTITGPQALSMPNLVAAPAAYRPCLQRAERIPRADANVRTCRGSSHVVRTIRLCR